MEKIRDAGTVELARLYVGVWGGNDVTIVKNMSKTPDVAFHVPENYNGVVSKTGTLIFWAEGVN